ncbi:MAG: Hsp20/alpha crystallin family protein [Prosthecobacter sp.]|jgi:HSP20 family protein|nr:Hsp20/alpha crystallin family protein [Prosthecobacter sp.]
MKLARYTPTLNLGRMADLSPLFRQPFSGFPAMAQLFEDFFPVSTAMASRLAMDLSEDDDNFYARFEVPGVKKDGVKVEVRDGVLAVSAERHDKEGDTQSTFTLSRSITLPDSVQDDAISAKLEDGILTITLPKQEKRKPRLISVN